MCDRLPTAILSLLFTYLDVASGAHTQCSHALVKIARLPSSAPVHYEIVGARHFERHHHWRAPAITLQPQSLADRGWTQTKDSLRRFASPRLRALDIYVAYTFSVLAQLTTVTDLTIRVTGYQYYKDDEQKCLHRLAELTHLRQLSIVGGGSAGRGELPSMAVQLENLPAHLEHLSLERQPLISFHLVPLIRRLDLMSGTVFSRFGSLRSLGVTCREFTQTNIIEELVSHVPQLQEFVLGECTATETSALVSRLARLGALQTLTFAARAPETDYCGRAIIKNTACADNFISAAVACPKLQQLTLAAFQLPAETAATANMNLCALGRLAHLRGLTIRDCARLVYVLAATPASSCPLDFRVISSAPVKAPFVVCYRPLEWNGASCVSSSGEIRVRL